MKLGIGTVQFGLPYGIANKVGQTDLVEAKGILDYAWARGINTIDTAIAYGDSEKVLGEIGVENWQVISKLPPVPDFCSDITNWVQDSIHESLNRLKISRLNGLLLHKPQQLNESYGSELYQALLMLKKRGVVEKIGISIYEPSELESILKVFKLDLVQAPFNLLDQRLVSTGWMSRLKDEGIELHIRSSFLQGLLLMERDERPNKFNRWTDTWTCYDNWLIQNELSRLEACIRYPISFEDISRVIVGVDNQAQLMEIINACDGDMPSIPTAMLVNDSKLLNPANWASLQ